jgi:hypothetical protein
MSGDRQNAENREQVDRNLSLVVKKKKKKKKIQVMVVRIVTPYNDAVGTNVSEDNAASIFRKM